MEGSESDTSGTSGINEATPLLHEDTHEIDDELYAISGACGSSDEHIFEINIDIEPIVQIFVSAWLQFLSERADILEQKYSAIICPEALHAMSTVWKQIRPEIKQFLPSDVMVECLAKSIVSHMDRLEILPDDENISKEDFTEHVNNITAKSWQQILDENEKEEKQERAINLRESLQRISERMRKQADTACVNSHYEVIVERLFSAWLQFPPRSANIFKHKDSAFLSPKALHAMSAVWKRIKAETKDLPESEVIIQGLAKSMVNYMYRLEIMAPDDENISKTDMTRHVINIVARCWQQILNENEKEDTQEKIIKTEEDCLSTRERLSRKGEKVCTNLINELIIDKLFTAWLKFPPRMANVSQHKDSSFLCPDALNAMSAVWKELKTLDYLPEPKIVVQGLMKCVINYMYQFKLMVPGPKEEIQAFTEHLENVVARGWQQIIDEIEQVEAKERAVKRRERRKRYRERLRKEREIAYVNWFYEPFAKMDLRGPVDYRIVCCILLCLCCSKFVMQVLIHTTLLAWPISIGTLGGMYLKLCPMSNLMLYVMIAIGFAGTVAILTRLCFAMYENLSGTEITEWWPTILVKILEFVFFVFILIQLFCFYLKTPSFDPGSPNYCNETFYKIVHCINYVSITVSSLWLIVYLIKGMITLHMKKYSHRPW